MPPRALFRLAALLLASALPGPAAAAPEAPLSYRQAIQPLFDRKCVACHACYDAPCQLNLTSGEGVRRGATRLKVYDSARLRRQAPTRLFVDAQGEAEWRRRGFVSVLERSAADGQPLLLRMVDLGRRQPPAPGTRLPADVPIGIDARHECPLEAPEQQRFARQHPQRGMPLGTPGLSDEEYRTLQAWLARGAPVDDAAPLPSAAEAAQVAEWEAFLNRPGRREQLVARWLYEHLFLAHLYFEEGEPDHFFELVRSRTPAPQPIVPIATAQPNEAPGGPVHYRLRPLRGSIVHKTHITYALSPARLARIRALFFGSDWSVARLPGHDEAARANPFTTFAAIPARARYQFMLDDAEYFVRTFIRGPVCRGSIATDVIRDHFWLFFQAPEHDLYVTSATHRAHVDPLLALPGQRSGMTDLLVQWTRHTRLRNRYLEVRAADYARAAPQGAAFADIWDGEGSNRNALLTIVRHHDSAAVTRGLWGEVPQTLWWMDYPLLEGTYYSLVVNFNVFDTVSHQAQTRLYFDLIRFGAESNFLRLLPPGARQALIDDWYQRSGRFKVWLYYPRTDTRSPTALPYQGGEAKAEFAAQLLTRLGALTPPDPLNRCRAGACYRPGLPVRLQVADQALSRLTGHTAAQQPVILHLPETALLRVYGSDGQRELYTLVRNRAHSNVAYMAGETLRHQPEKDRLLVYPGLLTSYPNFAFNVALEEVSAFTDALLNVRTAADFEAVVQRWGVRRTHPQFWTLFQDYTDYQRERAPREAGILDLNRYQNL